MLKKQALIQIIAGGILGILSAAALPAQSQTAMERIAGSWKGDKALGNVIIRTDGTGTLTFVHDSELTMPVDITYDDGRYTVQQRGENRTAYYSGIFPETVARAVAQEARPMRWVFQLTSGRDTLRGTKYTSRIDYIKDPPSLRSCDNSYSRRAQWTRLSGQVEKPKITPSGGDRTEPVQVSIQGSTPNSQIFYTIDGSAPDGEDGTAYTGPFSVEETATVKAIPVRTGWQDSPVADTPFVFPNEKITKDDGGNGMTIHEAKRIPLGTPKGFYHINDRNYTAMYYKFDVQAGQIYQIRIWDKEDNDAKYEPNISLRKIYTDLQKDSTVPVMEKSGAEQIFEIVPSQTGTLYMELRNGYYAQSGRFEIRVQAVD